MGFLRYRANRSTSWELSIRPSAANNSLRISSLVNITEEVSCKQICFERFFRRFLLSQITATAQLNNRTTTRNEFPVLNPKFLTKVSLAEEWWSLHSSFTPSFDVQWIQVEQLQWRRRLPPPQVSQMKNYCSSPSILLFFLLWKLTQLNRNNKLYIIVLLELKPHAIRILHCETQEWRKRKTLMWSVDESLEAGRIRNAL